MPVTTIASLLDSEPVSSGSLPPRPAAPSPGRVPTPHRAVTLRLRVLWGDLTQVDADVHVAGHYQGVLPAAGERALDEAISPQRTGRDPAVPHHRGVIAEHTRRRWLVGELGEIAYFPGRDPSPGQQPDVRRVAVAGMGRLGTFTATRAEQLYASLLRELGSLPDVRTAAMVLIGSGAGNLTVAQAAHGLVHGFSDVLAATREDIALSEVVIAEMDRLRAEQLVAALRDLTRGSGLVVAGRVEHGPGGSVDVASAAVFAIRALSSLLRRQRDDRPEDGPGDALLTGLVDALPEGLQEQVPDRLRRIRDDDLQALSVVVRRHEAPDSAIPPTRISVSQDEDVMRWAALTQRSTLPEREVPVNPRLVDDLVRRLTAPDPADAARLPPMLRRWIVPEDLQRHIDEAAPIVLEVDPAAARLPWEFLTDRGYDEGDSALPLALRTPIARQLRTTYSRAVADYAEPSRLRALVVADPGPPGAALPHALAEGMALTELLRRRQVEVTFFAGRPGTEPPEGATAATQLDVLTELLAGRYDVVHFAGHGTIPDARRPDLAGWLFSDGVLAARELAQMTWAPRLVTANACWSAAGVGAPDGTELRARLTAVLADEFLRVGVAHYIGTSWEVPDAMGRQFATSFYEQVLPADGRPGMPFGEALRVSRLGLYSMRGRTAHTTSPEAWSCWAAYQHYGDPADVLDAFEQPAAG